VTPSPTAVPPTATRTLTAQELQAFTQQAPAPIGVRQTPTAPPTLDVTPTFITPDAPIEITPVRTPPTIGPVLPAQPGGDPTIPTATPGPPTLAPTVALQPQDIPPTVSLDALLAPTVPSAGGPNLLSFAITTAGGTVQTGTFQPGADVGQTILFERNPTNPDEYALVNTAGQLYVGSLGNAPGVMGEPFTEFTYQVQQRDENDAAIGEISYAPNGNLAFIIDAGKQNKDGVWTFQGQTRQLLRDCPYDGHPGCRTVAGGRNASQWRSERLRWTTDGNRLIVELRLPDENRRAFVVLDPATANPEQLPRVYRYDSATWGQDNARVLASGIGPDGEPVIAWVNPADGAVQGVYNGRDAGIYPQAAVQRPDGGIVAFGSDLSGGGPVFLIDSSGNRLTDNIGAAPATRIEWSGNRAAALVQTAAGRSYIVNATTRTVQDISGQVGNRSANFIQGSLPPSPDAGPPAPVADAIPAGVVEGSRYQPGQQLQVASPDGLNVRSEPSTAAEVVGGVIQGDYVAVLAGPVRAASIEWWQVKTASNVRGWVAGTINGFDTLTQP